MIDVDDARGSFGVGGMDGVKDGSPSIIVCIFKPL